MTAGRQPVEPVASVGVGGGAVCGAAEKHVRPRQRLGGLGVHHASLHGSRLCLLCGQQPRREKEEYQKDERLHDDVPVVV